MASRLKGELLNDECYQVFDAYYEKRIGKWIHGYCVYSRLYAMCHAGIESMVTAAIPSPSNAHLIQTMVTSAHIDSQRSSTLQGHALVQINRSSLRDSQLCASRRQVSFYRLAANYSNRAWCADLRMSSTIMSPAIQTQQYNNNSSYVPTHAANTRTYYQAAPQVQPYSNGRISGNNNFANGGGVNMASYNSHRTPYGVTRDGTPLQDSVPLSTTNLYIRGLSPDMRDEDLRQMCERYGNIVSTKAIMDKASNQCKGYGFVDFEKSEEAARAVEDLNQRHIQAQMAKLQQQEQDPTNLYIANLPINYTEQMLEGVLSKFGLVISTRILRNADGQSRGVGFARMDSKEKCEEIISNLNGKHLEDMTPAQPALLVKQADSGRKSARKRSDINFDMSLFQPQQFGVHPDYMRMQPQMYAAPPYYNIGYQPMQPAYNGGFDVNAVATQMGHMNLGAAVTQPQGDSAPYYLYQQQGQQQQQFYRRPTYATGYEVGQANNNVNAAMVPSTYTNSSEDHEQYRTVHTGQAQ